MNANKMLFRGIKVGMILLIALLIVYGTMKASFVAFDYGYRYALQSLVGAEAEENTESTEGTEGTESTGE